MPESAMHGSLVIRITDWVREQFAPANPGLYVLSDSQSTSAGNRPWSIRGFTPDVFAGTIPMSFTLIGEAKCERDLATLRSENQLRTFIRFLAAEPAPRLVIATPIGLSQTARGMVNRLIRQEHAECVTVDYLLPF
jgi:hypothetical protein